MKVEWKSISSHGGAVMDENGLRNLLEQLHTELEHTQHVDDKGRELLRELTGDINNLLERSEGEAEVEPGLLRKLNETIRYMEVTHPALTEALNQILESLSNAGI
jgi:Domain of unknown function (DUF4404)